MLARTLACRPRSNASPPLRPPTPLAAHRRAADVRSADGRRRRTLGGRAAQQAPAARCALRRNQWRTGLATGCRPSPAAALTCSCSAAQTCARGSRPILRQRRRPRREIGPAGCSRCPPATPYVACGAGSENVWRVGGGGAAALARAPSQSPSSRRRFSTARRA